MKLAVVKTVLIVRKRGENLQSIKYRFDIICCDCDAKYQSAKDAIASIDIKA
jgi:hypothetical protein